MTVHYIEEKEPCQWTPQTALIGFVYLMGAHTGKGLGQLQFKAVERVGLQKRVSYCYLILSSLTLEISQGL